MQFRNGHETARNVTRGNFVNAKAMAKPLSSPLMFEAPPGVSTCLKLGMDKNDLVFKDDSTWKFFASTYEGQKHMKSNEYEIAVSSSILGLIEA